MATIRVAIDNIQNTSADQKTLDTFISKLREAGHTVTSHGIGPNKIQNAMQHKSNACDLMIQVAGGKCLGTLCDLKVGIGSSQMDGYYYAKQGGFAYFKCWNPDWKAKREPRDNFSTKPGPVKRETDRQTGKTLPQIFSEYDNMFYGYGDTAEECAKTFLANMGGSSLENTNNAVGGGGNIIDRVKEVCSDWNPYGVELKLIGDTLYIGRTNPNTAVPLKENQIIANSITYTDYDVSTPNTYQNAKDQFLIDRYGQIPLEPDTAVQSSWTDQFLQMAQRGHGHSIDLKCLLSENFVEGKWIELSLDALGIVDRKYYITKYSYDDERVSGLTLEPGPPQIISETEEVVETEDVNEEEDDTGEE